MNVFYEEGGNFKVGSILESNMTSLQVEAPYGKRSKIKLISVLLRFDSPHLSEFMGRARKMADDLDLKFLWECCASSTEFFSDVLATEYFGHAPNSIETAAVLIRLHEAPMYFYKKGRGYYKAAPPDILKAALASQERKRHRIEKQLHYMQLLESFTLPEEFKPLLSNLLYQPDKNTVEWKALDAACFTTKLSVHKLLDKCAAIPSSHDYHFNRFLLEHFPEGVNFSGINANIELIDLTGLPLADVVAFSIDDATTTEIDDAFSVTPLTLGSFRIGIHIAAPALGIMPGSPLDIIAAERLSTVYSPGNKITMFPKNIISCYALEEKRFCPAISMYLDVADDFTVSAIHSCIEQVKISANLRHETLAEYFNEQSLSQGNFNFLFGKELKLLFEFAHKMEESRGKSNDINNEKIDYSFSIENDLVTIRERRRGSPIDKVVSEMMIYINAEWGRQLAHSGIAAIYRSQSGGKVRVSTAPSPHQGLGVSQYAWISSPMRRYVDLINQRQLVSLLRKETPFYNKNDDDLPILIRNFEIAYEAYTEFQRNMERYWCLRWLLQEKITITSGVVLKENLVKLNRLPLIIRVPSLPEVQAESYVELEISKIDLLDLTFHAQFIRRLES